MSDHALPDPQVLVVAGEASGDMHAAALVRAMHRIKPSLRFFGIGGEGLAAEGLEVLYHASEMTVVGFAEVLGRYRFLRRALRRTLAQARERRPALAILVDYPGFNLRLARGLHRLGIPVVYYIAPQVWAWKEGRVKALRAFVDDLIVAFPFEVDYFRQRGITARFFGHPLVDHLGDGRSEQSLPPAHNGSHGCARRPPRTIAYLPGSRRQEIERHMPLVREIIDRLGPSYRHVIPRAATVERGIIEGFHGEVPFDVVDGSDRALAGADAALVKAGTSTVEAALHGVPFASFYRTSRISYEIARRAIRINSITMVNVLAGEPVVVELVQEAATADALERELRRLLDDPQHRAAVTEGLTRVRRSLGSPGAAARAAAHIVAEHLP